MSELLKAIDSPPHMGQLVEQMMAIGRGRIVCVSSDWSWTSPPACRMTQSGHLPSSCHAENRERMGILVHHRHAQRSNGRGKEVEPTSGHNTSYMLH
jgi:hypothetical protein